jgi:HEAT repeat protein
MAQRQLVLGNYQAAEDAADASLAKHPNDPTSWRVKIQSAMSQGNFELAAERYSQWHDVRGGHDSHAYRRMAITALWQGLKVPSPEIQARTIGIVETHKLEDLADPVRDQLGNDNDLPAAAAAVALMRSHPAAPRLATELLQSDNPKARAIAVRGIGKKVGTIAEADILPMLKDSDPGVRRAAVGVLADWKRKKDATHLYPIATGDKDKQVRSRALSALLRTGGDQVVAVALQGLDDEFVGARVSAIALLDKFGGNEVTATLSKLVLSDDTTIALRAATALYRRDQRDMAELFTKALASADWMTRSAALNTVASASSRNAALDLGGRGLSDGRIEVQLTAARVLLRLGVTGPALRLMREALHADQLTPRLQAATDLARRGEQEAIDLLSRMASIGPQQQREAAIAAHRSAGVVTQGLVAGLGNSNISIRLSAADVLLQMK